MTAHKKLVLAILLFAIFGMIGLSASVQGDMQNHSIAPEAAAVNVIPDPTLNANVSWSTFYNSWNNLEYFNGTGNSTLKAGLSNFYKNPISVNPEDIQSNALQQKIGNLSWQDTANWGASGTDTYSISNTTHSITLTTNANATTTAQANMFIKPQIGLLPSSNPDYMYITITGYVSTSAQLSNGLTIYLKEQNATETDPASSIVIANNTANVENGVQTAMGINNQPFYATLNIANITKISNPTYLLIGFQANTPASSDTIGITVNGLSITTAPMQLGTAVNSKNISYTPAGAIGNIHLNKFNPNFPYSEVNNSGYSVSVSQTLQNETVAQSSINDGNFIEEATYQGILELPSAPDLSYIGGNITMPVALPGSQYKVMNVNGQSYTPTLNTMKNGTLAVGSVNVNSPNTVIVEAYYTTSEWDSASHTPGFFQNPVATIEYYWYIFLGVALGAIGLGAGIKGHAQGFRGAKR